MMKNPTAILVKIQTAITVKNLATFTIDIMTLMIFITTKNGTTIIVKNMTTVTAIRRLIIYFYYFFSSLKKMLHT